MSVAAETVNASPSSPIMTSTSPDSASAVSVRYTVESHSCAFGEGSCGSLARSENHQSAPKFDDRDALLGRAYSTPVFDLVLTARSSLVVVVALGGKEAETSLSCKDPSRYAAARLLSGLWVPSHDTPVGEDDVISGPRLLEVMGRQNDRASTFGFLV